MIYCTPAVYIKYMVFITAAKPPEGIPQFKKIYMDKSIISLICRHGINYEGREGFEGKEIRFIPLWKWLLKI